MSCNIRKTFISLPMLFKLFIGELSIIRRWAATDKQSPPKWQNFSFHCYGSSTTNGAYEVFLEVGSEMRHLTESGVVHVSRSDA